MTSNQCLHAALTLGKDGWHCTACLRMFLPSGETGAEQETVRLRYLLSGARAYIRSFAELTQHPTARTDAMKLIERIDGLRPVETTGELEQLRRIDKAVRIYVENRTHGNYSKMCDALVSAIPSVEPK